jgi:hypothetical protein
MKIVQIVGGILIVISLVLFFAGAFGNGNEKIVSYPAMKQPDGTLTPLSKTTYRVNSLTQTIIYWMDLGTILDTPGKLVDCVVRDKKNWSGYYPDKSGRVQMYKGKIIFDDPNTISIGRCHWWFITYIFDNSSWLVLKKIIIFGSIIVGVVFLGTFFTGDETKVKEGIIYAKKHETEGISEEKKSEGN